MGDMNEWLQGVFANDDAAGEIGPLVLLFRLVAALTLGGVVALIYRLTQHRDSQPSPSFIATLVLLCVLLAMVTQVIGNSAARAFSLVGILSIVRFRTTVEDTRDTAFVIFVVILGMAAGVGSWQVALIGLPVMAFAAILLRIVPVMVSAPQADWTLQIRVSTGSGGETPWDAVFAKHCDQAQLVSTATARQGAAVDLTYKLRMKAKVAPMQLLNEINRIEGIQNVEMKRLT
jgi:uncharacterized membrane protein YhiD involved in acid resistance